MNRVVTFPLVLSAAILLGLVVSDPVSPKESNPQDPCAVEANDVPAQHLTGADLDALMTRYLFGCRERFLSALERVFSNEKRDRKWADALEDRISHATATATGKGVTVTGECHTSLCRYDVKFDASQGREAVRLDINRRLYALTDNTELEVRTVYETTSFGYRLYFYSTVRPSFVEPLRIKIEGAQRIRN